MRRIENIGDETLQRHTILFQESEIVITLRYSPTVELWTIDVDYKGFLIYGLGLAVDVLHMESSNQPFGFVVEDTTGSGLDPFRRSDFLEGRTVLYLVDADEMADIRGLEVPI